MCREEGKSPLCMKASGRRIADQPIKEVAKSSTAAAGTTLRQKYYVSKGKALFDRLPQRGHPVLPASGVSRVAADYRASLSVQYYCKSLAARSALRSAADALPNCVYRAFAGPRSVFPGEQMLKRVREDAPASLPLSHTLLRH